MRSIVKYLTATMLAFAVPSITSAQESPTFDFTELSAPLDQLFWCASAYYVMGIVAETDEESENFLSIGERFLDLAKQDATFAHDTEDEYFIALVKSYDELVRLQFSGSDALPYDAKLCLERLVQDL